MIDDPTPGGFERTATPEFSGGMLRVASRDGVVEAMREQNSLEQALNNESEEVQSLVGYLNAIWDVNQRHKREEGIQDAMVESLRARNAEYDPAKLSQIQAFGGSDIYMGLTGVKCRAAESWILDVLGSMEKPWSIRPTPEPTPTEEILEEVNRRTMAVASRMLEQEMAKAGAEGPVPVNQEMLGEIATRIKQEMDEELKNIVDTRTRKMETKIHDQLTEGGWVEAFESFVGDLVTLKTGIIKGPVARIRKRKIWTWNEAKNRNDLTTEEFARPEFVHVSPFDIYPSPDAVCVNDGSLVERIKLSRRELIDLKNQPGYDPQAIDEVLSESSSFSTTSEPSDQDLEEERETVELREPENENGFADSVRGLEFWCSVQGKMLKEHGVEKVPGARKRKKIEDLEEYQVNAILVAGKLIYVDLNEDPLGERPYFKTGWSRIPGSFWYQGVPELMSDLQKVCNASMRALVNNLAISSGPQAEVDVNRLLPGENLESVAPLKIWQTTNKGNNASPAVRFFQPDSNANELMGIYDRFAQLADDYTGIPAYAYGNERTAGAGRTSSGLSMLMSAAAKGIKRVFMDIEKNVIRGVIQRQFEWNKRYLGDEFKGDIDIVPTGVVAIMMREQLSERRMQFLQATANPEDMKVVGLEGRAAVIRETAMALEIPNCDVTRSAEELKLETKRSDEERDALMQQQQQLLQTQQQAAQAQAQAAQMDAQLKQVQMQSLQAKTQLDQAKIQLEFQKLELEMQKIQLEAQAKGIELDIKGRKVDAEAIKDMAVASDLGVRGLMELSKDDDEGDEKHANPQMRGLTGEDA